MNVNRRVSPATGIAVAALSSHSAARPSRSASVSAPAPRRHSAPARRGTCAASPTSPARPASPAHSPEPERCYCTGRAIQVRRLGIGSYEVRFVGNGAQNALASGGVGVQASAERIAPGIYRVGVYPSGRADPADFPFLVVLV
jgi:hypothetical protein